MKATIVLLLLLLPLSLTSILVVPNRAEEAPNASIEITYGSYSTYINQRVELTARVTGGTPPYTYQWYSIFIPQDILDRGFPILPDGRLINIEVPGANSSRFDFVESKPGTYNINLQVKDSLGHDTLVSSPEFITVQSISPQPTSPDSTSSPTPTVPEFSWLTTLPLLLAIPIALVIIRKRILSVKHLNI